MEIKRAKELFRGKEKYNCVQAVLKAYQHMSNISDEEIFAFSESGGGRIGEGMCGAFYAAEIQSKNQRKIQFLTDQFKEIAGSIKCKEIRKLRKISCSSCVETAAMLTKQLSEEI